MNKEEGNKKVFKPNKKVDKNSLIHHKNILSEPQFEVLKSISSLLRASEIAKYRKINRSSIYKTLSILLDKGHIEKIGHGDYTITSKGTQGLHSFMALSYNLRQHNLWIKLGVQSFQKRNWEKIRNGIVQLPYHNKRVELKNNYYDLFSFGRLQIKATSKSILIKIPTIFSKTVDGAVLQAMEILFSVIPKIENLFKIKLVKDYRCNMTIISQEYAKIEDALAKIYRKEGNKLYVVDENKELRFIADYSFNVDEFEAVHPNKSPEDMAAVAPFLLDLAKNPTTMSEIRETLGTLTSIVTNDRQSIQHLGTNLDTHFEVLKGIKEAVGSLTNVINDLKNEVQNIKKKKR